MLPAIAQFLCQQKEHSAYFHQLRVFVEQPISERKKRKKLCECSAFPETNQMKSKDSKAPNQVKVICSSS